MKVKESDSEKLYFDHDDPEDLENIISTQRKVILHMKKAEAFPPLFYFSDC